MNKLLTAFIAISIVTMIGGFTFAVGADAVPEGLSYGTTNASSINLTGVTDTIQELFIELIPLIAIMSILGGLLGALPKMFKFDMGN